MKFGDILKSIVPMAANLVLPGSGNFIDGIMKDVAGTDDLEVARQMVESNPDLQAQVLMKAQEKEIEIQKEITKRHETVNATMRAELEEGKWYQKAWRPFNGYLFPIAVISCYFVLPLVGKSVPPIPWEMWVLWASVLGVSANSRGKEKLAKMGVDDPGFLNKLVAGIRK